MASIIKREFPSIFSRDAALESDGPGGLLTRGALFLGIEVNYLLWGVQITQSYHYYKSYRASDRGWLKGAVVILFIASTLQTIFASMFCWRFTVQGLTGLPQQRTWEVDVVPFLDAFTASIVHFTYTHRISTLLTSPYNHICAATVLTLSCVQLIGGLGGMIFTAVNHLTPADGDHFKSWGSIWLVAAAVADIVIAIIMTQWLSVTRPGIKKPEDVVSKLIRWIAETGVAMSIAQLVEFVLFIVLPFKPYHICVALFIPKVYSNSMLALLNSRESSESCSVCQGKPVDNVILHSSHMVGTSDYELDDRPGIKPGNVTKMIHGHKGGAY